MELDTVVKGGYIDKIHCADCIDFMAQMPDECIDLVVTSPPYNLGNNHHLRDRKLNVYPDDMPEDGYQRSQLCLINECLRLLKPSGSIFYNHKNRIAKGKMITPYQWLLLTEAVVKQEIVWYNGGCNFDKCRLYPMTERIYWLSKGIETQFRNTINKHDLWNYSAVGSGGIHQRAFPVKMILDILDCFPEMLTVLDPYMGSGSTAIACIRSNRHYIGIELEQKYVDIANERIRQEQAQLKFNF